MKLYFTFFIACLSIPAIAAESPLDQLGAAAGTDVSEAKRVLAAGQLRKRDPVKKAKKPGSRPNDVFAECRIIDAKFSVQPALEKTVEAVNACLAKHYHLLNGLLTFNVEAVAVENKRFHGVAIRVTGQLPPGSPLYGDLQHALDKREGKLMGWPAKLDTQFSPEATTRQDVFGGCKKFMKYELSAQRGPTVDEAADIVMGCLNDFYHQTTARRTWSVGAVALPVAFKDGQDVMGIVLLLSGRNAGDRDEAKADLEYSIQQRFGHLLGWPASIEDAPERSIGDCTAGPC